MTSVSNNKKLLSALLIALFFLSIGSLRAQQNSQFSQYMYNGVYINPAYSGYKETLNANTYYRSQGGSDLEGHPQTFNMVIDASANDGKVGLSLMVMSDQVGAEKTLTTYANYAYRLKVSEKGTLAFGMGLGISQYGLDGSKLDSSDPNDPDLPTAMETTVVPDLRFGIHYSTDKYFIGVSADNLIGKYMPAANDNTNSIPTQFQQIYISAGGAINAGSVVIKPNALWRMEVGGEQSLDVGAMALIEKMFWIGTAYRQGFKGGLDTADDLETGKSIIVLTQVEYNRFKFGYSYDIALNKSVDNLDYGAHEISLGYTFGPKSKEIPQNKYF